MGDLTVSITTLAKVGSLVRHIDEMIETGIHAPGAAHFDLIAIQGLLADPDVSKFMDSLDRMSLLPVKR